MEYVILRLMPFNVSGISNSVSFTLSRHSDTSENCTRINHLYELVNQYLHVLCKLSSVTVFQ
jgi:hypothetical protein